ncbi:MAG: hypothetical protein K5985_02095 [Lachnospiraceae bacterium]|nr:hypothetical protein [Lachnospiraceae bacterium]
MKNRIDFEKGTAAFIMAHWMADDEAGRRFLDEAVRTDLAIAEPLPPGTVSEDANTWYRYAAYPGRFVFLDDIKNQYRICSGTDSRARSKNKSFYAQKAEMDSDGFEKAAKIAVKYGLVDPAVVDDLRARFYVRLALSMLRGGDKDELSYHPR